MMDFELLNNAAQRLFGVEPFPAIVSSTVTASNLPSWVVRHKPRIRSLLEHTGAVLFRGLPIDSAERFDTFSGAFGYQNFTYKASLSNAVRINLTERVFTANEAPPEVEIFLHHELAQTPVNPARLFFYCQSAADQGGATPLCRSDKLYERFRAEAPDWAHRLEALGVKYTTRMPPENDLASGQGRSWRSTLDVDKPEDAQARLDALGYGWRWLDDGSLIAVTPALPAVKQLGDGSKSFFNQLVAAWEGWRGVRQDPSKALSFGDDSPIPAAILEKISHLTAEFTVDLVWQEGDVALLDNHRTMHGRRPYSGDRRRQVLVAMALDES